MMYANGWGVRKYKKVAAEWFGLAADGGYTAEPNVSGDSTIKAGSKSS